jgi:hypothetical protein
MTDLQFSDEIVDAFARRDHRTLYTLLGLKPWEISPLDADDGPCPYPGTCAGAQSWPHAQRVRRALEKAVAARKVREH